MPTFNPVAANRDVAIFATAKRMGPPTRAEGFDELYRVAIRDDGEYEITPVE